MLLFPQSTAFTLHRIRVLDALYRIVAGVVFAFNCMPCSSGYSFLMLQNAVECCCFPEFRKVCLRTPVIVGFGLQEMRRCPLISGSYRLSPATPCALEWPESVCYNYDDGWQNVRYA